MQEAEPAGCMQMWESLTSPPHLSQQVVRSTRVSPAWCSTSGSTFPAKVRRVKSGDSVSLHSPASTCGFGGPPAGGDTGPAVVQVLVLIRETNRSHGGTCRWIQTSELRTSPETFVGAALTEGRRHAQAQQRQVRGGVQDLVHWDGLRHRGEVMDSQNHHVGFTSAEEEEGLNKHPEARTLEV